MAVKRKRCALCGGPPPLRAQVSVQRGDGQWRSWDLHHDTRHVAVGHADGASIVVTCYEAWTRYGLRELPDTGVGV